MQKGEIYLKVLGIPNHDKYRDLSIIMGRSRIGNEETRFSKSA